MKRIIEKKHESRITASRFVTAALIVAAAALLTAGCAGLRGSISIGVVGDSNASAAIYQTPGSFDNNSTVRLRAGRYTGDLNIRSNKVTIEGRGTGITEIHGDVQIHGNSCTLRNVTVTGNVYLYGNNNDLRNARIAGKVTSRGKNNRW